MKTRHINKRVLSGIKPTGDAHIGNYLGAMSLWPKYQSQDTEVFYFVANLHSLNVRQDPKLLRERTLDLVAWLLAVGVDPQKSVIYVQSMVPAHSEMTWILNNYTTMGELNRMTQFKDKALKGSSEGQLVGLYDYPVLMAADILLYDADEIPVGDDQVQHVELTRDIANRFNNLYGDVLHIPEVVTPKVGARVMGLNDPKAKMSKSDSPDSYVMLLEDSDTVKKKFKRAVTDSDDKVLYDKKAKPAISNLLEIYQSFCGKSIEELEKQYKGKGYGQFKEELGEVVAGELAKLAEKYKTIRSDEAKVVEVAERGSQKAAAIANKKLAQVKEIIGLL